MKTRWELKGNGENIAGFTVASVARVTVRTGKTQLNMNNQ